MHRTGGDVPQQQHNEDRMRRADSWLKRADRAASEGEKAGDGVDGSGFACERFLFLWISFNAAYGYEAIYEEAYDIRLQEREKFEKFLGEIVKRDTRGKIENVLWVQYAGPVRILLDNEYVFHPFWESVRGSPRARDWEQEFASEKRRANRALGRARSPVFSESSSAGSTRCAIRYFTAAPPSPRAGAGIRSGTEAASWRPSCR